MKIRRFIGKSVNGYLNFDIEFLDRLTFVTGINGSGKTSALNSIAALLLPKLDYLSGNYFDEITLEVVNDDDTVRLSATKTTAATEVTCSLFPNDKFTIVEIEFEDLSPHRARQHEEEYYRSLLATNSDNPVLRYIETLPIPMYLGLDRRSLSIDRQRPPFGPSRMNRRRQNIFGQSLNAGLREAQIFARDHFRSDRRLEAARDQTFRNTLVLTLFDFPLFSFSGKLEEPSKSQLEELALAKENMRRLPRLLDVDNKTISNKLNRLFAFLDETQEKIKHKPRDSEEGIIALLEWSHNRENIDRISKLSEITSRYNSDIMSIKSHINEYLDTVNGFVQDSGKKIFFNSVGDLRFTVTGEDEERHISTLSSGELQLLVILTHLYFNPEAKKANVFIIDEPELSLHVEWQEKFVDGITAASSETQFILATHSPSIILDKIDNCVEIV